MRTKTGLFSLALALGVSSSIRAQTPELLVKQGTQITGLGTVTSISYVQILDSRTWVAQVDTDHPDTTRDGAILRNGLVFLREGDLLSAPSSTILDDFDSINMSGSGDLAMCLRVTVNGVVTKEALYWNTVPIALKDDILSSPLVGPGTDWETFDIVKMNSANEIFVVGDVNNPSNGTGRDATLCKFTLDGAGAILATEVLLTKGQFLPALGTTVLDLSLTEHSLSVNERGDYLTLIMGLGSINAIVLNGDTIVAQEGLPSPIAGRTWDTLVSTPKMWLNDNGDYIHAGSLSGSGGNYLIAMNGEKFAQSGDNYPTWTGGNMLNGSAAPLVVANDGAVFWRGDSSTNDDAFLRNFTPILQQNVTTFNGDLVLVVDQADNAFSVSSNGRFFAGRVDLQLGGEAVLFVDSGLALPFHGCLGNAGKLAVSDGLALPGNALEFAMDDGNAVGALPFLVFSTQRFNPASDCGLVTSIGEILLARTHRLGSLVLPPWNGLPSTATLPIPPDLSLVDQVFFAQGAFHDVSGSATPAFRLTNGLRIEIGAP